LECVLSAVTGLLPH